MLNLSRALACVFLSAIAVAPLLAAKEDPVQWTLAPATGSSDVTPGGHAYLALKASIMPGWHLYSPTTPAGGPIITSIRVADSPAIASYRVYRPKPVRKLDPNFQLETETYTGGATFLIDAVTTKAAAANAKIAANVRYQACSDTKCLNPVKKTATTSITVTPHATTAHFEIPPGYAIVPENSAAASQLITNPNTQPAPTPTSFGTSSAAGIIPFLVTAFGFGLAALFTPCVFPMIPITVSFFLNQSARSNAVTYRRGWKQALLFCVGIIVLFTGLGFVVTAIAGPFGLVQLGSSPWVNGFIAAVFFVFALSLLGAFELRLPSDLLTKLDRASRAGGYTGTLLMGLTFSLTSFACIGPIVGPLLVASVQTKGFEPVLGMAAFATGLAAPFFFLALFPSYVGKLPRSGAWMSRVKIVLGFIVLAVMLKYVGNVDQVLQLHWLTRERFLATWIVLFALPGLYLLGLLRMEGISKDERLGVARALIAAVFLIFSLSLVPGLFGARLGDLDAFIPEPSAGSFVTAAQANGGPSGYYKNQMDAALMAAKRENKLVLVNFTGYACTNCHWMKANMFTRPEIQSALKDLIELDLYTDGTDPESERNRKFENDRFNTASIPFYALIDADQRVIATFPQLTRDPQQFLNFLEARPTSKPDTAARS